tara:strand:- start:2122 stop:2475 length:354 start_codon:yes stop_codon:yes gene_type:complete
MWREKKKILKIGVLFLILIATVFISRSTWSIYQKNNIVREKRNDATQEFLELSGRHSELTSYIDGLQSERGLEEEVRKKFQVSKPGEYTVVLLDPVTDDKVKSDEESLWEKIKSWFQ